MESICLRKLLNDKLAPQLCHLKFVFTPIYIEQKASKMKPSSDFVERMGQIADSNPGTPLADKYGRRDQKKDKATRKVLKKHGVI